MFDIFLLEILSYLTNIKNEWQKIFLLLCCLKQINSPVIEELLILCGVHQGSILGPFLFYINYIFC